MIAVVDRIEEKLVDFLAEDADYFWFQLPKTELPKELRVGDRLEFSLRLCKTNTVDHADEFCSGGFHKNPPRRELV